MTKKLLLTLALPVVLVGCNQAAPVEDSTGTPEAGTTEAMLEADAQAQTSELAAMEVPEGATRYEVVTQESTVEWYGAKAVGNSHTGTVDIQSGSLYRTEDGLIGGQIVIDMTTITESKGGEQVTAHLKSEDFFGVENHPTATLTLTNVEEASEGTYNVTADLTIKGITNSIEFVVETEESEESVTATTSFEIDRSKWDVRFGSGSFFDDLGDELINDEIEFDITLVANAN